MSEAKKPLCGFLNILKPPGMTSSQVVGYVRWLLNGAKVGHGGTLDPEASGVLPLMIGKAARLFDYMQEKEKVYVTEVAFGAATDTQDAQGRVIASGENFPDEAALREVIFSFTGQLWQGTAPSSRTGSDCMSWRGRGGRRKFPSGRSRYIHWNCRA